MADRYWVGGTGTWDTTSTTNWSATSGGASGASVPTAADNVIFDSATTYTVTLTGSLACLDITVSAGTVTFNDGTSPSLTISGGMTLVAGTVWNTFANLTFNTTASKTLTTNGVGISGQIEINAAGGTITLGSALTINQSGVYGSLIITNGTFSTSASNYNFTGTSIIISPNSNAKTLSLNGSTLTLGGYFLNQSTANFTLNAGTSSISFILLFTPSDRVIYSTSSITFYNVTFSITDAANFFLGYTGYTGSMTFNNLTFSNSLSPRPCRVYLYANITVNGTFSVAGSSVNRRYQFFSDVAGTSRTITAATVSMSNADFKDITGAGAGSWTGTSIGNFGGNSGITFTAAKTVYYKSTTMGSWNSANWATTSGGTASINNLPIPQDTAIIDDNSGTGTLTMGGFNECNYGIGTLDCSSRTTAFTLNFTGNQNIAGDLKLCSAMTVSGVGDVTNNAGYETPPTDYNFPFTMVFIGGITQNVTSSGKTITIGIGSIDPNTTVKLIDNMSAKVVLYKGTIDINGKTLTTSSFSSPYTTNRTLAFGLGNVTVSGSGASWNTNPNTNIVFTGTPVFNVANASGSTIDTGNFSESTAIDFNFTAGGGTVNLFGSYKNLNFTGSSVQLNSNAINVYGNFTASTAMSFSGGASSIVFASTSGSKTITANGRTFNVSIIFNGVGGTWVLQDNLTIGNQLVTLTNGTLDLNGKNLTGSFSSSNSNIRTLNFGVGKIILTQTGTIWDTTTTTNLTIAGTPVVDVTGTGATARTVSSGSPTEENTIDFNFKAGTYTLTISGRYKNLDFTGFAGSFSNSGTSIYGNLLISTGMSFTASTTALTFASTSGTKTITSNGRTIDCPVTFNGVGGTWSLQDNTTVGTTRTVTLTNGSLLLNTRTLTCGLFASNNSNVRTLDFGTGKIVVNSTGTLWNTGTVTNLTVSGTPVVDVNNNTATATTISPGALSEANSISFNFISGTYTLTLNSNYRNVNFTGFAGTLGNQARTVYGDWTISTGMTLIGGSQTLTFAATSGSKTITSNGKTFDFPVTFNGIGGTWVLQDNLTVGFGRVVTHTNGTLDLNGKTLNSGIRYLTAVGTKNLTFNGGTLLCSQANTTAFNNAQPTGFTTTAGTGVGKISMSAATAKTFVGGGSTYNCTLSNDGAGALTISGSNTFTTLANGVQPTTFTFTSGTTTTVTNWNISGTAGNLVTIGSTTTSQHTLSDASGIVSADYLSISYSNAIGGAAWYAGANSTDGGNNTGWIFSSAPITTGNFFLLFN